MNIKFCVSKEDIAKLFGDCCRYEFVNYQSDDVFEKSIIEEFSKNYRTVTKVKVYFEKDKYANPYYSSNIRLHRCSQILQELCTYCWGSEIPLYVCNIINSIYELLFDSTQEADVENKIKRIVDDSEDYIKNIAYYITNNIVIISRWAGGSRSSIQNDCEFEAELSLFDSISKENVEKVLNDLCKKHGAKWVFLD